MVLIKISRPVWEEFFVWCDFSHLGECVQLFLLVLMFDTVFHYSFAACVVGELPLWKF